MACDEFIVLAGGFAPAANQADVQRASRSPLSAPPHQVSGRRRLVATLPLYHCFAGVDLSSCLLTVSLVFPLAHSGWHWGSMRVATLDDATEWTLSLAFAKDGSAPVDITARVKFSEDEGYEPPQGRVVLQVSFQRLCRPWPAPLRTQNCAHRAILRTWEQLVKVSGSSAKTQPRKVLTRPAFGFGVSSRSLPTRSSSLRWML